jgi:transposase
MLLTEGQASDCRGAALLLNALSSAKVLISDKGYGCNGFRDTLAERGFGACIPSKQNRKIAVTHDCTLYRQRHKIEIMFGHFKDWLRFHPRYDRCAHAFSSAICIAATVIFWLSE